MVVTALENTSTGSMKISDILPKLQQAEQRMEQPTRPREAIALVAENRECFYCGKRGHLRRNCPKRRHNNPRPSGAHSYGAITL
jgi:hypothetical protein